MDKSLTGDKHIDFIKSLEDLHNAFCEVEKLLKHIHWEYDRELLIKATPYLAIGKRLARLRAQFNVFQEQHRDVQEFRPARSYYPAGQM